MKPEYDFSKGARGKFYRPDAEMRVPIYLDAEVQNYLAERAAQRGMDLGELVNGLLKQDIQIMESVKYRLCRFGGNGRSLSFSWRYC